MKQVLQLILLLSISSYSYGQMIMNAEGVIADNACEASKVYFLMERKAKPVESIEIIQERLNEKISFTKENPLFEGKSSIQFAVNCKGEIGGGFHVVTKSGNDKLDQELIEFFKTIKEWNAGKKNKKKTVDSWYMWRLEIKEGNIAILNK